MHENKLSITEAEKLISMELDLLKIWKENKTTSVQKREVNPYSVELPETYYIKNSYYFENLRNNKGSNIKDTQYSGSCSYVAVEMLLSYYDSIQNDNIIDEKFDVTSQSSFLDYSSIAPTVYIQSPGVDDNFHDYMINFGRSLGYTSNSGVSISLSNMPNLIKEYLQTKNILVTPYLSSVKPSEEYCKSVIASNNPILLHIFGTDLNHAVVGYGYETDGIHVNYGWKNSNFNTCISKYTIARALYINIDSKHNCSNNYHWTVNGITGTICPCGKKVCNHGSKKLYKYDDTYHKLGCLVCGGDYTLINHSYVTNGEYKTCSDCGHRIHTNHRFIYTPIFGGKYHWARCRCGYENREPCMGYASVFDPTVKCNKCGQTVTSGFKTEDENQPSFIIK